MLHIAICDDNPDQLAFIFSCAQAYFSARAEHEVHITQFDNSLLFLENLDKCGGCDIALLDICMPGILGTDVAKQIRARRDMTEIIFLTTSDEYAIDAFSLKAAHYLLKPFTIAQFDEAMNRAMARFSNGLVKTVVIKSEGRVIRMVDINDILYIESRGHILTIYTKVGPCTEARHSLSRLEEELHKLSPGQFISPYKGYIVNQKSIRVIEREHILLCSGDCVPIPKRGFREIQNAYFDYMFGQTTEGMMV